MSKFEVPVKRVEILDHNNADNLEIAKIQGTEYQVIVGKGEYETGDLVVYIPEDSIVPEWIQEKLGVKGKLAGSNKNRVRAVRLRGVYSQGLCYPVEYVDDVHGLDDGFYVFRESEALEGKLNEIDQNYSIDPKYKKVEVGNDVQDFLGIEKYEPPIPVHMSGEVFNARGNTLKYDIENFKKYPDLFEDEEEIVIAEKLHGTWCCVGVVPPEEATEDAGRMIITSKGLSSKGLALKLNEENEDNVYVRAAKKNDLIEKLPEIKDGYFYILGEVFGNRVQDLEYGAEKNDIYFRAFDIYIGEPGRGPGSGRYLNDEELSSELKNLGISRVPVLYKGPYNEEVIKRYTSGKESFSGDEEHIREGIVVRPVEERTVDENLPLNGRLQLKRKSEDYLTRNNPTERH